MPPLFVRLPGILWICFDTRTDLRS